MGDILAIGIQRQSAEGLTIGHQLQDGVTARHFRWYTDGKVGLGIDHHLVERQRKANVPLPLAAVEDSTIRYPHLCQVQIVSPNQDDGGDIGHDRIARRRGYYGYLRHRCCQRRIACEGGRYR